LEQSKAGKEGANEWDCTNDWQCGPVGPDTPLDPTGNFSLCQNGIGGNAHDNANHAKGVSRFQKYFLPEFHFLISRKKKGE
jgi:hypothetical protein